MEYIKKEKYTFKVLGSRRNGSNLYYTIKVNEEEYFIKAFEFQKQQTTPSELICICKGYSDSGHPIFMQDIAALIEQLYKVGDVGTFRVRSCMPSRGFYEVVDSNGFYCRLTQYGDEKLYTNQTIKCRVIFIDLVRIELELISSQTDDGIPLYTEERVLALASNNSIHPLLPRLLFNKLSAFSEARKQLANSNPLWVLTMLKAVDENLNQWLLSDMPHKKELLQMFTDISVNLLENSNYLQNATNGEKQEYQEIISKIIVHAQDYLSALEKVDSGQARQYIEDLLERLKTSGYLYDPERRMRVAMSVFALQRRSMHSIIQQIFDIIKKKHDNNRFMALFRNAFVEMLDIFLRTQVEDVNIMATAWDRSSIREVVEGLAIALLLLKNDDDDKTHTRKCVYRSSLYRYSSMMVENQDNADRLTMKAYEALFGEISPRLEYDWEDLDNITLLCSVLASTTNGMAPSGEAWVYEGNNARLRIANRRFTLMPIIHDDNLKNVVPSQMYKSTDLQVYLEDRLDNKPEPGTRNPALYHLMWKEIEAGLFADRQGEPIKMNHKRTPYVGDVVTIRITRQGSRQSPNYPFEFYCEIEDPKYAGSGLIIPPKHIAGYGVRAMLSSFRDRQTGKPFLLRAEVESVDERGYMTFSMRREIAKFNQETLGSDQEYLAQIVKVNDKWYQCITEAGIALSIPRNKVTGQLEDGDYIIVEIYRIFDDGTIHGKMIRMADPDERFERLHAFNTLVEEYADGNIYEDGVDLADDDDDEKEVINTLPTEFLRETISIIDRKGMIQKDQILTYNYLALARLLSIMLEDEDRAHYYTKRMKLVEALFEFGHSGKIDDSTLDSLLAENSEFVERYPDIANRLTQLKLVNQLDNPRQTDFLWRLANKGNDRQTGTLAQLVLAHNLLGGNDAYDIRQELKRKIYKLLDLEVKLPDSAFVANEDPFTELKTSVIYSAKDGNMLPNERVQIEEIMKVVCSFLNKDGGTLYVGVNDSGMAVGLTNDFTYLNKGHRDFDVEHIKDVYDRLIRDNIHAKLGVLANDLCTSRFEQVDKNLVYRLDVKPSPSIVKLNGLAYVRQGTSKHIIPTSELTRFKKQREKDMRNEEAADQ